MIFLDTSALIKAYLREEGTSSLRRAIDGMRGSAYVTRFVALEVLSALAKQTRANVLTRRRYRSVRAAFLVDLSATLSFVTVTDDVLSTASELVGRYRRVSVSAMDVLHVASALELQAHTPEKEVVLATSDHGMLALAKATGLKTFDSEVQPLAALLAATG